MSVPILCLASVKDSNIFVSGGMGGRVIVWELNQDEIKFIVDYPLGTDSKPQVAMQFPKKHIQSLHIGEKKILVGTRSGDIWELTRLFKNTKVL